MAVHRIVEELIAARKAAGLTQEDIGQRMGIGRPGVNRLERGRVTDLKLSTLDKYADAVGLQLKLAEKKEGEGEKSH